MTRPVEPARGASAAARGALRLVCCGTRGSLPAPGPHTVRYGGNTPCVELQTPAGRTLILDGGTGIVRLGRRLADSAVREIDVLLTHFHWDHIHGLPFFAPFGMPAARVRIHGEPQRGVPVETLVAMQLESPFFPKHLRDLEAQLEFHHIGGRNWTIGDASISSLRMRHPEYTVGFRIECDGAVVVYIPDNEPAERSYPVPESWEDDLLSFVRGADLLVHDAMFTTAEYESRHGWGHGTFEQAVQLAETAAVRTLLLFHHAPHRSDDALDDIVGALRDDVARRGSSLRVHAAEEGKEYVVALPATTV